MKEFKQKPLIGLEDLGDSKYSLHSINNREKLSIGKKSDNWKNHVSDLNKSKRLFTEQDIIEMKELYRTDVSMGLPELSKKYNVDKVTIHNIMHNKIYSDIGGSVTIRKPLHKCIHCGIQTTKTNISRFHNEKCKHKNNL